MSLHRPGKDLVETIVFEKQDVRGYKFSMGFVIISTVAGYGIVRCDNSIRCRVRAARSC